MTRLVAISQRVDVHSVTGERRDALDQQWAVFLAACGLVPVPVPNHVAQARALCAALPLAGVILSGGNDLAAYGGDSPERDGTEAELVALADARGLPVLGICRGAQHLAHLAGGTLRRVEGHVATRHRLDVGERAVNSFHNYAIAHIPPALRVLARSAEGDVESFDAQGGRIRAIMWHPEREAQPHAEDIHLFRSLFGSTT